ncbi:MAG: phosphoribosylaminoimidazolesuccinocarboxamide synthase [Erysipelotrichales bacterium]|nr:phosphoribosylaminoimidazolesuccinocarboxamide synthase [Erysipelotrichales bacterium]
MAELLYEGKAKQVYLTDKEDEYIIHYKDDATAGNGVKHEQFAGKGVLNNTMSCIIFDMLEDAGIKTHMIEKINERDIRVKKVEIFPLEIIVRNITTGSFCKRLGVPEGVTLDEPIFEMSYKNDEYGDPLINDDHAVALNLVTREELTYIKETTLRINELLKTFFLSMNLKLVDFKVEFGKTKDGDILLADEISPDSCRLWDVDTNQKYDKDVFRQDIGNLIETYKAVLARMEKNNKEINNGL